ncbi:hypothetical protein EJ08DRAFT_470203 [Tothia fuscella]|uniref:Uncharacterized protein n=1 Tax=Tothia fuscella TaxID=1048955 RepID=A0A9P4NY18_9PEZI|nr:hypothetical protein EJ08DRAFT_470203 [Tothia fuscella]
MATPTSPPAIMERRPSPLSQYGVAAPKSNESETIELIPTSTQQPHDKVPTRGRAISLALSDITLQDRIRSRADSIAYSDATRDSSANWDNYCHVSLATDSTRNASSASVQIHGGNGRYSKQSLLSTTRLIVDDEPEKRAINHVNKLWTPWSLRLPTLIAFSVLFLIFFIILEVLAALSRREHGLGTVSSIPPVWSYVPVVIFCIQAALWAQLEIRTKQLTPWNAMAKGPSPASQSILLDYLSPMNIMSFFRSLKKGHYAVALTIFGSILLKIMIISSAALIGPRSSSITQQNIPIGLETAFDAKAIDVKSVTAQDALVGAAIRAGLMLQPGINGSWAFQTLKSLNDSTGVQMVSAPVEAFFADLTCEQSTSIKVSNVPCVDPASTVCEQRWTFGVASADCDTGPATAFVNSEPTSNVTSTQRFGLVARAFCGDTKTDNTARLVITTGTLESPPGLNTTKQFENAIALVCKPNYTIQRSILQSGAKGASINPPTSPGNGTTLESISPVQVADAVWSAVTLTGLSTTTARTNQTTAVVSTRKNAFNESDSFISLISLIRPDLDLNSPEGLERGFREMYSITAAQIAKNHLLKPTDATVVASIIRVEKHLRVRNVPLRLMEVALILLIVTRLLLVKTRPAPSTPRDLSTLGGLATVMGQSHGYTHTLQGLGAATMRTIKQTVGAHRFQTCVSVDGEEKAFKLEVLGVDSSYLAPRMMNIPAKPQAWWTPIPDAIRMAVLAATFGLLVAVELLLQKSKKHNGLADMNLTSAVGYAWLFIPALLAVLLWQFYTAVDFSTRLLSPYLEMQKSPTPAGRSLHTNYLPKVTVVALRHAIVNKHFAVALTALSVLLAPVLIVVSSGLFQPKMSAQRISTSLPMLTAFDMKNVSSVSGSQLPIAASLVTSGNVSWPRWTRDDLVFPELKLPGNLGATPNTTLDIRVPAMFSLLNCTQIADNDIKAISQGNSTKPFSNLAIPVNKGCGSPCPNDSGSDCVFAPSFNASSGSMYGRMFNTKTSPPSNGWNDDCPQTSIVCGKASADGGSLENLVAINCYPAIMQVNVNIIFSTGSWSIMNATADKNATRVLHGDKAMIDLSAILVESAFRPAPAGTDFDIPFQALVTGRDGIAMNQLSGENNVQAVKDGLSKLYARVMSQHLNLNARSDSAGPSIPGTITTNMLRLHQSEPSTRILEVILGLMFLLVVVSSIISDTRKVLPNNPCSIAVMSSLIAESEFVKYEVVHKGSEWYDDAELVKRGIFEGCLFSLGVWEKKIPNVFGIDVGKADKAE